MLRFVLCSKPGFEIGGTESCLSGGDQGGLCYLRPVIAGMVVWDNLARILGLLQELNDDLRHGEAARAGDFRYSIDRCLQRRFGYKGGNIFCGDGLELDIGGMDDITFRGLIGNALDELEELSAPDDGVRYPGSADQVFLSFFSPHIAAVLHEIDTYDREGDVMLYAGIGLCCQQVTA